MTHGLFPAVRVPAPKVPVVSINGQYHPDYSRNMRIKTGKHVFLFDHSRKEKAQMNLVGLVREKYYRGSRTIAYLKRS
jgi:hypothetical protein